VKLVGKTIAITGAGRGLGAAMALRLARHGTHLALLDLDKKALGATRDRCLAAGAAQTNVYQLNVADEAATEAAFAAIADDYGALHGLVNNAGITRDALTLKFKDDALVSKMSLEQWQQVLDVNLTGVFLCGREAARRMIELGCQGCIVNVSSISRGGNMGQINYSASKAGVQAMAVVWSKEFARYGLRAAAVAPGFIATEMVMSMKADVRDRLTAQVPIGRIGEPDEIAHAVEFVFENDYVNGRCLEIDGGQRL
jgi:3-oxoacyl-[acyl-carrier protein] reductase